MDTGKRHFPHKTGHNRQLLRKRFLFTGISGNPTFEQIWGQICISHIEGEETSQYLIDRCLMRPRSLIELIQFCRSHAVNLCHEKINIDDIKQGEEAFSTDLVTNISLEILDVYPEAGDILYEVIESKPLISRSELDILFNRIIKDDKKREDILRLLLWYGFIGLYRKDGDVTYIYNVKYDMKRMWALIKKAESDSLSFYINPAFWKGLEIKLGNRI